MGYGGVATVLVDMLAALTVLPALLAVLGPRVNALRVRRSDGPGRPCSPASASPAWPHSPRWPTSRRRLVSAGSHCHAQAGRLRRRHRGVLAALGSPFLHITWGGTDARVLPAAAAPRQVTQTLNRDFPGNVTEPIESVVRFRGPVAAAGRGGQLAAYVEPAGPSCRRHRRAGDRRSR